MMSQKDIEKRMKEIEEQIKDKQEEINDEIIPGSYFYDVDKVENLKKEIQKMQEEYEELDETPTIKKVDADLKDLNEKLALVEEELKEANGSYFLTDDMKELDEQRKELIETIADREETKQILVELEQIEKDLEDLEEEINDLSGAYFIPEDITKEKEEKENRKKELEEKLKDKKVKTKLKDIESVKDSKNKTKEEKEEEPIDNPAPKDPPEKPIDNPQPTNPPKVPKGPETIIDTTHPTNPPKVPKEPETTIDTSSTKDKPDEPETIWAKIKNKVKDLWNTVKRNTKKALVGLGVGALAISGTGVPIAEQEVEKTEFKLDTKDFNFDLNIPQNPQDIASNLRVGDIITVDNLSGFETSDGTGKVGNTDYLTKSGSPIKMIVTKIVEGKENGIHLSLYGKDAPQDLTVGGESNLVKIGEFQVAYLKRCMDDGMSQADAQKALDKILPYIGTDDIWTSKDAIAKRLEAQDITVTINGKIPILKAEKTTETKYNPVYRPDADKHRIPEYKSKYIEDSKDKGTQADLASKREQNGPDDSKDARLERIKRAREKSKNMTQEDMDRLLDEMAENAKTKNNYSFGDEYRVDNKDSHIEAIAIASVAKKEQENKSVQQEKNDEDKTK